MVGRISAPPLMISILALTACYEGVPNEGAFPFGSGAASEDGDSGLDPGSGSGSASEDGGGGTGADGAEGPGGPGGTSGPGGGDEAGPAGTSGNAATSGVDETGGEPGMPEEGTPASDIFIADIEVNQGVAIPVVRDGSLVPEANRNAPLIRNRHMLVRVYWETGQGFSPRDIEARLTLDYGNGDVEVLTDVVSVNGPPNPNSLGGTFTFELDPQQVAPGMNFSVGLFEKTAGGAGPANPPRFPATGTATLGVPSTRMRVALTIVPYRVGSQQPNLGAQALEVFREHFYGYQPIEHGEDGLRIRVYPQTQSANSADAQAVLGSVCSLWNSDVNSGTADQTEYYQAAIASSTTYGVLGVAYVLNSPFGGQRCGANLWNSQLTQGPDTMTHEIGHNMGRPHAPCGVNNAGAGYPYQGGAIGVQGWDPVSGQLVPPNYTDYMGYCQNNWTSDYNFRLNAERTAALQVSPLMAGPLLPTVPLLVGHETTDGRQYWSVYEGSPIEYGLSEAGTATVWTVEGRRLDVPVYARELSEGRAVVAELPELEHARDVSMVSSEAFGSRYDIEPAILSPE